VEPRTLLVGWLWTVFLISFLGCLLTVCTLALGLSEGKFTTLGVLIPVSALSGGFLAVVAAINAATKAIIDTIAAGTRSAAKTRERVG